MGAERQAATCIALGKLASDEKGRAIIHSEGAVLPLVDLLHASSAEVQEHAASTLSLLAHGEASVRQTAALRLSKLCQRPIDFDPHAPGSERRLQIERLSPLLATDSQNSR